jgi:transposase-like protein
MKTFHDAVLDARRLRGWTVPQIASKLGVSAHTVQSWLKPASRSSRIAPPWAALALGALSHGRPAVELRGGLRITYAPAPRPGRP